MKKIIGRECKFVFHLPKVDSSYLKREDTHVIKEVIHYEDGGLEDNLRIVENYKRPYYITKTPYRNHTEKKEAEDLNRVNKYTSTQSDLPQKVAMRLGPRYIGSKTLRDVRDSPYVYGIDISSKTYIKHAYLTKYPDTVSRYKVATFDIETDTIKDEVIIISLSMEDKIYTVINKNLLLNSLTDEKDPVKLKKMYNDKLNYLYNEYIPTVIKIVLKGNYEEYIEKNNIKALLGDVSKLNASVNSVDYDKKKDTTTIELAVSGKKDFLEDENIKFYAKDHEVVSNLNKEDIISKKITSISSRIKIEYDIVDNEMECVTSVLNKAHEWKPDFIAIWNINYDIPKILDVCEKYNVNPADIFTDPTLPENLRYFRYKQGQTQKKTESGKHKPINSEEQWHVIDCPASFYWIDAMSSHRFIRQGGKTMPGGYSLDNILRQELGSKLGKLYFKDEKTRNLTGLEWHLYMVAKKPLEYIIYNQWDNISMLELDSKTKDLQQVLPMLSGVSSFDIFNSGPKKIVDGMHFFYLEQNKLLGSKPNQVDNTELLGLGSWIVLLPSYRIKDNGKKLYKDSDLRSNIRTHTYDSDQVSGYPSNTMAANVSRDTTVKELLSIGNIDKEIFRLKNINLFFGVVNTLDYGNAMFNLPTIYEIEEKIKDYVND